MLRRFIKPILIFPLCLYINSQEALFSEPKNDIEEILQEKKDQIFINFSDIHSITLKNNQELK